jgi:hypothetical protein
MPKKPKPKKNPTDPAILAHEVVEAAIGQKLFVPKAEPTKFKKYKSKRKAP